MLEIFKENSIRR